MLSRFSFGRLADAARAASAALAVAATVVLASSCADPQGEFDAFAERQAELTPPAVDACKDETCKPPTAAKASGDFVVTLIAKQFKKKPIMFTAAIAAEDAGDGALDLTLDLQPINAKDRKTPVGDPLTGLGPYRVEADGKFVIALPEVTVGGPANPVTGTDITANVTLAGRLCTPGDFTFGTVTGTAVASATLELDDGSFFAFERITDTAALPAPVLDCSGTDSPPPAQ